MSAAVIYCDYNATAPLHPEALAAMRPFLDNEFGNPSSVHALGRRARCAVEDARVAVAALIGAEPRDLLFTSGATESNNLAILGAARAMLGGHVVTSPIEHASVREPTAALDAAEWRVDTLPVDANGRVGANRLATAGLGPGSLVSVGWANNEVGTVQPVEAIAAVCRRFGALLHVDAAQALGKIPVDVRDIDLLAISGHKIGGPKGIGALYVRPGIQLENLVRGGGQERGRRAGTENVPAIVGFGAACVLVAERRAEYSEHCAVLCDALWKGLHAAIVGLRRNGAGAREDLPNTLNVSVEGVPGEALVAALDLSGVAVAGGSACAAGAGEPSHVLLAMGRTPTAARDGVRFSLGWRNTPEEIERVVARTADAVTRIRSARRKDSGRA